MNGTLPPNLSHFIIGQGGGGVIFLTIFGPDVLCIVIC